MKLPAMQFYVGDWRKDPGVQSLSYHERGVWFELLLFMHESERRGVLLLNGTRPSDESIARLLGLDARQVGSLLELFVQRGVADLDPDTKALMNRRMVRDEKIRCVRAAAGRKGGLVSKGICSSKRPSKTQAKAKQIPEDEYEDEYVRKKRSRKSRKPSDAALKVYEAYPRKVARPKALEAIEKALTKVGCDALLKAVKRFATSVDDVEEPFIPHPTTWFNQERWTDVPSEKRGTDSKRREREARERQQREREDADTHMQKKLAAKILAKHTSEEVDAAFEEFVRGQTPAVTKRCRAMGVSKWQCAVAEILEPGRLAELSR